MSENVIESSKRSTVVVGASSSGKSRPRTDHMADASEKISSAVSIIPGRADQVETICKLHPYKGGEFTFLGLRVLRSFYKFCCSDPRAVFLAAVDDESGEIVGLVFGGDKDLKKRFYWKNFWRYGPLVAFKFLVHPGCPGVDGNGRCRQTSRRIPRCL